MMAKLSLTAALVLILSLPCVAQKLNHPLRAEGNSYSSDARVSAKIFPDTLRVMAIMVQFQSDADPLTSGNGQFDITTAPQRIIDAPPRDSAYFADHMLFAKNYFQKASNGKQNIAATVLGTVFTLSKQMKQYAPVNSNSPLGEPDLFDTKTGRTAIGRFGLMDGQAIFSFSGLFPPEPSAWEKIFLGWTSPITVAAG